MDFSQGSGGVRLRTADCGLRTAWQFGFLDIRGIVAFVTTDNRIFARVSQDLKLVRERTADRASVGFDRTIDQTAAIEDTLIGGVHVLIFTLAVGKVGMKGVGIFHDELAPTHQPEPRPYFLAKLGL